MPHYPYSKIHKRDSKGKLKYPRRQFACPICGNPIDTHDPNKMYCTSRCVDKARRNREKAKKARE